MKKEVFYYPSDYARLKGVKPSRITHIKEKLVKKEIAGKWVIVDCEQNDKLFDNAHINRGKKIGS